MVRRCEYWVGKNIKSFLKALSQHIIGMTKENYEKSVSTAFPSHRFYLIVNKHYLNTTWKHTYIKTHSFIAI